jgi:3-oxoadipate enol-lactonase
LMAADINNLMDSLKIKKAILVGHSMGGYVSLAFVKNYPDRLGGLGLVATQAAADSPEKRQVRLDSIQQVKSDGVAPIVESMLSRLTSRSNLYPVLRNIMVATPRQGVIGTLEGIADREDSTPRLKNIRVPTLIIAGIEDMIIALDRAEEMARLIPNAWLVKIPGAGHMPMMETPDSMVNPLLELIETVKAKRSVE